MKFYCQSNVCQNWWIQVGSIDLSYKYHVSTTKTDTVHYHWAPKSDNKPTDQLWYDVEHDIQLKDVPTITISRPPVTTKTGLNYPV